MYVKGAPEVILDRCRDEQSEGIPRPLDSHQREMHLRQAAAMAADALRVLALAYRPATTQLAAEDESELIFLGLVGMKDPPREEAREAVRRCYLAGIRPVMITGDHPATALAIARELCIAGPDDESSAEAISTSCRMRSSGNASTRSASSRESPPNTSCELSRLFVLTTTSSQ